jgi:uncharacterized protein DUF3617
MRQSTVTVFSAVLALIITASFANPVRAAEHEYLKATPGLWKVNYRTQAPGQPDPAIVKWRCVGGEEQLDDPWSAFVQPPAPHETCKRISYSETSKSISWKSACTSDAAKLNTEGLIRFDTTLHYTGEIKVDGEVMGYPIANTVAVEGIYRAACTTPDD